jgi:N-acetylglucosaminyldiphosphoundecaprenol N-acetyl-beta-D-mannosaminyltransferase
MANILGIKLYNKNIESSISEVIQVILSGQAKENRCVSATGAHGIVYAKKHPHFKELLNSFYINLPDGMPGVWVGFLKGEREMRRCYGPTFFNELMVTTAKMPIKHFFCGGKEGVAEELKKSCIYNFFNSNIVGTYCPPFREMTENEFHQLGEQINISRADIVWIGLSTPKQEQFAYRLKNYTNTHFIITVGAAFDFHTGRVRQAPKWMRLSGTEWFFRLLMEPRRLYKRYGEIVPLFIYYNLKEFAYFCLLKLKIRRV